MIFGIKVYICKSGKKCILDEADDVFVYMIPLINQFFSIAAYSFYLENKKVLQVGYLRCFAAYP